MELRKMGVLAKASDQGRAKEVNDVSASLEVLGRAKRQSRAIDDTFTAYNFQGV